MPTLTLRVSTTRTAIRSATSRAAARADSIVADNFDDRFMHTTPSAPSAARRLKASTKAPGAGAAVSGRALDARHMAQNSCGEASVASSGPTRIVKGTMVSRYSAMTSLGRSQALSATTRIPGMCVPPSGHRRRVHQPCQVRPGPVENVTCAAVPVKRAARPSGHLAGTGRGARGRRAR